MFLFPVLYISNTFLSILADPSSADFWIKVSDVKKTIKKKRKNVRLSLRGFELLISLHRATCTSVNRRGESIKVAEARAFADAN